MIVGLGDNGGGWVVHYSGELHKALPKMVHVICKLKIFVEVRGVDELKHLLHGEGVERTNRHVRSFKGRQLR